jgi:hypothetical protein
MRGSHPAVTLVSDLEAKSKGRRVSFPCKNLCMERVLPEERGSPEIAQTQPDSVQNAEQVSVVKQS